jgi:rod shape-determining protein MreC
MFKKNLIYIFIVFLLTFIMLFQPTRSYVNRIGADFFYPFFNLILKIENIVDQKALTRKSKNVLTAELLMLQKSNSKLTAKCEHLETLVNENSELRKLLDLKVNPYYNYIFAEIIYRDPVEWFNHFSIDKGSNDGIEDGAVVLARINTSKQFHFGVVGRIGSVSKHTASVDTIVSDKCKLSVLIPENGATGIVMGGKRSGREFWSKISYLPRDLIYKHSSSVLTSGMNSLTPANLKVGTIIGEKSTVGSVYNNLFVEAMFKPAVDLNHLKFVLILVKK